MNAARQTPYEGQKIIRVSVSHNKITDQRVRCNGKGADLYSGKCPVFLSAGLSDIIIEGYLVPMSH